jgi:hypothetical protein
VNTVPAVFDCLGGRGTNVDCENLEFRPVFTASPKQCPNKTTAFYFGFLRSSGARVRSAKIEPTTIASIKALRRKCCALVARSAADGTAVRDSAYLFYVLLLFFAPGPLVTLLEGQFSLVGRIRRIRRRDIPVPKVNAASSQMPSSGHNQRHRRYDRSAQATPQRWCEVQWVNHPAPRLS